MTLSKRRLGKMLIRLHSLPNQWAAREIWGVFILMEKILILLLAGKIFNRDAQYRNFQVMLVLPELVEILFFKMVERKTILLIFSTVKQNQCWDELVSAVLGQCKAMQVVQSLVLSGSSSRAPVLPWAELSLQPQAGPHRPDGQLCPQHKLLLTWLNWEVNISPLDGQWVSGWDQSKRPQPQRH